MSIKVQLNSLEALERLIGGDSEVEMEIRGSIVQKFADKHLKALASTPLVEDAVRGIKEFVQKELAIQVTNLLGQVKIGWGGKIEALYLHSPVRASIAKAAEEAVGQLITEGVNKAIQTWGPDIDRIITNRINRNIDEIVATKVRERIAALIK